MNALDQDSSSSSSCLKRDVKQSILDFGNNMTVNFADSVTKSIRVSETGLQEQTSPRKL